MKILVTGLSGFVGGELLSQINHHDVIAFGRRDVFEGFNGDYYPIDLNDHESVRKAVIKLKPEACVHLAWQDIPNFDTHTCLTNFSNSVNLASSLTEIGCSKVIVTGTCLEYQGLMGPCNEALIGNDLSLFGRFKHGLNLIWEELQSDGDYHWIRPFYIYGKNQRLGSLLPYIMGEYKAGKIPILGNPHACNDYVHVSYVARLISYLLDNKVKSGPINAGSGLLFRNSEISDFVGLLAANNDSISQFTFPKQTNQDGFYADISLSRDIGFENKVRFKNGIRDMYESMVL